MIHERGQPLQIIHAPRRRRHLLRASFSMNITAHWEKKRFRGGIESDFSRTRWESFSSVRLSRAIITRRLEKIVDTIHRRSPLSLPREREKKKAKKKKNQTGKKTFLPTSHASMDSHEQTDPWKKSKRRVVTRVYLFLWWKIAGPIYIPSSNAASPPLPPLYPAEFRVELLKKHFQGRGGEVRNTLQRNHFDSQWKLPPGEEGRKKKLDTVVIRTKFVVKR